MIATKLALAAAIAVASGAMAFAPQASASDGTITITGKVLDQTCTVSTGYGNGTAVVLEPVPVAAFTGNGVTAKPKDFEVNLANCPANPAGVQVAASFSGSNIDSNGYLKNTVTTGGASGVAVALYDQGATNALNLSSDHSAWQSIASGGASLPFTAKYISTGTVSAGELSTSVDFTLIYQ